MSKVSRSNAQAIRARREREEFQRREQELVKKHRAEIQRMSNTHHKNIPCCVALIEKQLWTIPEGQGIGAKHDKEDDTHTGAIDEPLVDPPVPGFYKVLVVSLALLQSGIHKLK